MQDRLIALYSYLRMHGVLYVARNTVTIYYVIVLLLTIEDDACLYPR